MFPYRAGWLPVAMLAVLLSTAGCARCTGTLRDCTSEADCNPGELCVSGTCTLPSDGSPGTDADTGDSATSDSGMSCPVPLCGTPGVCCAAAEACLFDTCVPAVGCTDSNDCVSDSYCDLTSGMCVPYGVGPGGDHDPTCTRDITLGVFSPAIQCEWLAPPAGDPYPNHVNVLGTPVVADFDFDNDPTTSAPSVVFVSYNGVDGGFASASCCGLIRILDGQTCNQMFTLDDYPVVGSATVAVADLDNPPDGRPEIVALAEGGGMVAFEYDPVAMDFVLRWHSTTNTGANSTLASAEYRWNAPSITELTGDNSPEIVFGSTVHNSDGVIIGGTNLAGGYLTYSTGIFPVIADVDADGTPEYVRGSGVWELDPTTGNWVPEPYVMAAGSEGYVAVGDFGDYPVAGVGPPTGAGLAEVVVISSGFARIQTIDGAIIFGPYALPGGGSGGPPTIGDFDNDGFAEFALAGNGAYSLFDFDCVGAPAGCYGDGILWSQPSQDFSSNRTGSSVFDFESDGAAEAVYADECFTRVYDGATGAILFSQSRSSCTWNENPVVADVDGDFNAELVVGSNTNCGTACPAMDPYFPGTPCSVSADCVGLSPVCVSGYCRCATDADCGISSSGLTCTAPLAGTPGAGNVCRAAHAGPRSGIRVYSDAADNWVSSRPIWNQHAYFVTNILDDGTILPYTLTPRNWDLPDLNNFRANVIGDLDPESSPDATAGDEVIPPCALGDPMEIPVRICNRGTQPVAAGLPIAFYEGDPAMGMVICVEMTTMQLDPGMCETLICTWASPPVNMPTDITIVADDDGTGMGTTSECYEGNNTTTIAGATCSGLE